MSARIVSADAVDEALAATDRLGRMLRSWRDGIEREAARFLGETEEGDYRVELTITVELDPAWVGHDRSLRSLAESIVDTIDHEPGMTVSEASRAAVTS
ncbi:hypothetical protein [Amycolatopsis sp. Poz14]|uniref:hypothetical protein n=1 Tax=Amycolatopsis sp. Poz14 TaxID=1447705 RepID=UPI001EE846BE|nr:hypothetical protein [Amycolatopsis sp. Poz14]MCG3757391.1 hypothetical protein [Amycolatopsis sp. Poz14]